MRSLKKIIIIIISRLLELKYDLKYGKLLVLGLELGLL